jgi:hypothetical protein
MRLEFTINPRKIGLILGIIALYLAVQSIIAEYLLEAKMAGESGGVVALFLDTLSVNAEETIPTWYSVAILLIASAWLAVIARAKRSSQDRFSIYWIGLTLLFLYLSMDEGAAIHEILADPLQKAFNTTGYLAFGWQIVAVPAIIIFGLLYLRFLFHLPPRIRNLFIVAGVTYAGGALVGDAIGANEWVSGGITLTYLATGTLEELMEMLGVVVFIYALLSYIVDMQYAVAFRPQPLTHEAAFDTEVPATPPPNRSALDHQPTHDLNGIFRLLSRIRPAALIILLLVSTNLALLYWTLTQKTAASPLDNSAVPFFHAIADQLQTEGVVVVQTTGAFSPDNLTSRKMVSSLLTLFDNVVVVTMPSKQQSIIFAGNTLPFDQNTLSELLRANGEEQFIIYDTTTVKLIAGDAAP